MSGMVVQVMYLPNGCEPDNINAFSFAVYVVWCGKDQYAVRSHGTDRWARQLSRRGHWKWGVEPFQRHQYRFTLHEAEEWAEKVRHGVEVNGRTFAEWEARDLAQTGEQQGGQDG